MTTAPRKGKGREDPAEDKLKVVTQASASLIKSYGAEVAFPRWLRYFGKEVGRLYVPHSHATFPMVSCLLSIQGPSTDGA
jgi:hypothetical protein